MSTILVTGASGFVGSHLVPALADAGHRVRALVRDDTAAATVSRRLTAAQRALLEPRRGDVTRPDTLPAALSGADAVLHLAAVPRDWDGGATLRLVNTEGTRFVLRATLEAVAACGGRAEYMACDVRDPRALAEAVQAVRAQHGPIGVLIHGAGVIEDKYLLDKTSESFDRVTGVKVEPLLHLAGLLDARELLTVHAADERISLTAFGRGVETMKSVVRALVGPLPTR